MKTTGEILRSARQESGLSLKELSRLTRIDVKYIQAIEANDYSKLPSATFTKGFIRNLSIHLNKNPQDLIALFRRDYHTGAEPSPAISKTTSTSSRLSSFSQTLPLLLAGFVFLSYLIYQYRAILIPPRLELITPQPRLVLTSPVTIEGQTSSDSIITLNSETNLTPDPSGHFLTQISFPPGEITLLIEATNRFSRTNRLKIPLTIINP
ncbi:helix-turn-helix domain-containing protein [Candidatus Collierbacteria bacterium]|nr:helix-turn-helix domain-containing protein [Candidatus Collierbacteria bacterium]